MATGSGLPASPVPRDRNVRTDKSELLEPETGAKSGEPAPGAVRMEQESKKEQWRRRKSKPMVMNCLGVEGHIRVPAVVREVLPAAPGGVDGDKSMAKAVL